MLNNILETRFSTRAFLDTPVAPDVIQTIFSAAQKSPSNCNVQPWQALVVSGQSRDDLSKGLVAAVMSGQPPNPDFAWNVKYQDEHRARQFGSANALYSAMGIARDDKMARNIAMLRNWQFFDAPHAVFFTMDTYLGIMGAVDMGIYAQTLSLLMSEYGISSCMQGALGQFPDPVKAALNIPQGRGILFGMSFGYADLKHDANKARTERETLAANATFFE